MSIELILEFRGGEAFETLDPREESRIDRTGAGGHHEPVKRREPHRGVHGTAAMHGGERRARPQMAGNDPQPILPGTRKPLKPLKKRRAT